MPTKTRNYSISTHFIFWKFKSVQVIPDYRVYMIVYIYSSQGTSLTLLVMFLDYYKYKLSYTPYYQELPPCI